MAGLSVLARVRKNVTELELTTYLLCLNKLDVKKVFVSFGRVSLRPRHYPSIHEKNEKKKQLDGVLK